MKILVLNCGSTSMKYRLIETSPGLAAANQDRLLAKGLVERIPAAEESAYRDAISDAFARLTGQDAVISSPLEIDAVGHRFVHGGEQFTGAVLLDDDIVRQIDSFSHLAPLHNPPNIKGYHAACALLPHAPQVAVFDTAFHLTLPPKAFIYGIPYELYERLRIRRYGFHGTSHRYVCARYAQIRGVAPEDLKLITCHLGSGCSVCAIDRGRSVDTSLGFTPLEGLMMGTRPGDLDPGILLYLLESGETTLAGAADILNRRSGLLGISGVSNDMRDIVAAAESGHERAALALAVFCQRVKKYVGAFSAVLNGADAVVFTGGIGEHRGVVRRMICDSLDALGIRLDESRNERTAGVEGEISASDSKTKVWVIPTDEESIIARDTMECVLARGGLTRTACGTRRTAP